MTSQELRGSTMESEVLRLQKRINELEQQLKTADELIELLSYRGNTNDYNEILGYTTK